MYSGADGEDNEDVSVNLFYISFNWKFRVDESVLPTDYGIMGEGIV